MSAITPFSSLNDTELLQIIAGALVDPVTLEPIAIPAGPAGPAGPTGATGPAGVNKSILSVAQDAGVPTFTDNTTIYVAPGGKILDHETDVFYSLPFACTLRNLYLRTGQTPSTSTVGNTVVTVRKNGVDTMLTVVMPTAANSSVSDTTHSVSFAAGDILTIGIVSGAGSDGGSSAVLANITMELDAE